MKGNQKYGKKVNGTFVVNAHNNIIQVGYNYGIPAMILYIILNALSLIYSIRYYVLYHDRLRCAAFPMLITLGFLITSLTECLLLPMQSLLAFAYYLSVAIMLPIVSIITSVIRPSRPGTKSWCVSSVMA